MVYAFQHIASYCRAKQKKAREAFDRRYENTFELLGNLYLDLCIDEDEALRFIEDITASDPFLHRNRDG